MMLEKEDIEKRIKELDGAIIQQGQYVQQMNNQILMFHGAKEEYNVMLKKIQEIQEAEKLAQDEANKKAEEDAKNKVPGEKKKRKSKQK